MKNRKIRILCAALAMLLGLAVLAGCSEQKKDGFVILKAPEGADASEYNYGDEEYAIAFRKGEIALVNRVQEILDELYEDGTAAEISKKWFGEDAILRDNDFPSDMTVPDDDSSLQDILDEGKLVMGFDNEYPPMGFIDEDTNETVGFDIDLAKAVAEKLGVELVLQPISWGAKEMELDSGKIDCIWSGLSVDPERAETFTLSKPYLPNAQIILTKEGSGIEKKADLAGKKVGTQEGSAGVKAIEKEKELKDSFADYTEYPDYYSAYLDLKAGRIDALVGDKTFIEYILANKADEAETTK